MALQLRRGETRSFGKVIAASFTIMAFVLQPLVSLNIPSAFAVGAIDITTEAQLRDAIEHQANGQIWNIHTGNYGLSAFNDITAQGQTGWYFPITANNLTINGVGNPTIYGTGYSANGNWATQNFVTVFGDNVTIKGVTLMPKVEPNKTIEVIGNNFTLKNAAIEPNTLTDQSEYDNIPNAQDRSDERNWGGSVYFSNTSGTETLSNVIIKNGGISDHASGSTLKLANVRLDYATNVDWINSYRYAWHGNTVIGTPKVTYHVSTALNNLDDVLATSQSSDTISLDSDLTLTKQMTLTKAVTLEGNGHTVSPVFAKTDNDNNSAIGIQSNSVTINDLVEDGVDGTDLHGINVNSAKTVVLNGVAVNNNDRSGLNVNASKVKVIDLTTAHNGWDGVDVDKAGAVLTVQGISHHDETTPDIYVDKTSVGKVVDTYNQYNFANNVKQAGDRVYDLKLAAPTNLAPGLVNTNDFWFTWDAVQGAHSYEWQGSQSNTPDSDGNLANVTWTGDYQHVQPTAPTAHSIGASGTWYWQVRAVDANGVKGPWSPITSVTIDTTPPAAPSNLSWLGSNNQGAQNGYTNIQKGTLSWKDTTPSDVNHYVYKFWTNIPGYQDDPSNPWHDSHQYVVETSDGGHVPTDFADKEGTYYFCVEAVDAAGNESACTQTAVTYDKTKPTVQNLSLDKTLVNGSAVVLNGDVNDANLLNYQVRVQTTAHANTTPYIGASGTVNTDGTLANLDVSALSDGNYVVRLWATDKAGNSTGNDGVTTYYLPFTIDRTAPHVAITGYTVNGDGTYTIAGTTDDNSSNIVVTVGLNHITATPVNGHWSVNTGAIADGTYTITATSTDAAGNATPVTQSHAFSTPISQTQQQQGILPAGPGATNQATPVVLGAAQTGQVLGAQTTTPQSQGSNDQAVKGVSTTKDTSNNSKSNSIAWYWWLIALAVIAGLWWLIAARRRKKSGDIDF